MEPLRKLRRPMAISLRSLRGGDVPADVEKGGAALLALSR
jgi:hypothetical protein